MAIVYVQNKDGKPLMPTTRNGHVRRLLKEKKARVVERNPFTVRLEYDTPDVDQELTLGIDPGRTNIGVCVVTEDGVPVLSAQLETRNKEVPKLMAERKAHRTKHRKQKRRDKRRRRARAAKTAKASIIERKLPGCAEMIRCHDIRNKEARFNNRKRPDGWLTPTANHLLETHINLIRKICKYLPISKVVLELNKFAFMALNNPGITKWEYQRGPLHGYGSVEEAVYAMQGGTCLLCKRGIDHYHHIVPRSKGGSETLENRAGLCGHHHDLVHKDEEWASKLAAKKGGSNKKYHALSVLNQIIPKLTERLAVMFPDNAYVTTGRDTANFRTEHGIPKDHHLDAYCIACSILDIDTVHASKEFFRMKQYRRNDRQCCQQEKLKRRYLLDGKVMATNRHKSMEQKEPSLAEFRQSLEEKLSPLEAEQIISRLTVKEHHPIYKDTQRPLPGSIFVCDGTIAVMQSTKGKHNGVVDNYIDTAGNKHSGRRCKFIQTNTGIRFIE